MKPLQEKASCANAAPNERGVELTRHTRRPHATDRADGGGWGGAGLGWGARYSSSLWFLSPVSPDQCCGNTTGTNCVFVCVCVWLGGGGGVCVGLEHTRMTTLESRAYFWLCFEKCPVGPDGGPHVHTSGGQTWPTVVYRAFPRHQPGGNGFALGSLRQTQNVLAFAFLCPLPGCGIGSNSLPVLTGSSSSSAANKLHYFCSRTEGRRPQSRYSIVR